MAEEPKNSEIIGYPENLDKYAPEYKEKDLLYLGTTRENQIISNRMKVRKTPTDKLYYIQSIDYDTNHTDTNGKPKCEIDIYTHDKPDLTEEIDEYTHLKEPYDEAQDYRQEYRPENTMKLNENQTRRLLTYLDVDSDTEFPVKFSENENVGFKAPDAPGFRSNGYQVKPDITKMTPAFVRTHQGPTPPPTQDPKPVKRKPLSSLTPADSNKIFDNQAKLHRTLNDASLQNEIPDYTNQLTNIKDATETKKVSNHGYTNDLTTRLSINPKQDTKRNVPKAKANQRFNSLNASLDASLNSSNANQSDGQAKTEAKDQGLSK